MKWQCTVCKYIHTGEEPPKNCPVCGADQKKFVPYTGEQGAAPKKSEKPARSDKTKPSRDTGQKGWPGMVLKHHLHPMSVHVPNGVIPVCFVFIALATVLDLYNFYRAAFYNYLAVLAAMPVVLHSGYIEWKLRYGGALTARFIAKFFCGGVVTAGLAAAVIWHIVDPAAASAESPHRWILVLGNAVILVAAGIAGHIGGKFVFRD